MADSATPGSNTGKHPSIKDKQCPFCHQTFTSSSLGRHLDLYIREKNAKPPDDVHDVEEIRKIRAGITRRQARSSTKRDGSTPSSTKATPQREHRSPPAQKAYSSGLTDEAGAVKTYWNTANWQATGVINDLPPTPREDQVAHFQRDTTSRRVSVKEELTRRQAGAEERDRGRAAELALKEVLESVKVAKYDIAYLQKLIQNTDEIVAREHILLHLSSSTSSASHSQKCTFVVCHPHQISFQDLLRSMTRLGLSIRLKQLTMRR